MESFSPQPFTEKEVEELKKLGTITKEELTAYVESKPISFEFGKVRIKLVKKEQSARGKGYYPVGKERVLKFLNSYPKETLDALEGTILLQECVLRALLERFPPALIKAHLEMGVDVLVRPKEEKPKDQKPQKSESFSLEGENPFTNDGTFDEMPSL